MSGSLLSSPRMASADAEGHLRSPAALRASRPTWRDPRLVVGVGLVCLSVLVGVKVMAGADDTVPVLAARHPVAAGQQLRAEDLTTVRLRFATGSDADRYLPADGAVPLGAVLMRPVGAGELLPRTAVTGADQSGLAELPLAVDAGRVPASVRPGATVDVWVGQGETTSESGPTPTADRVLANAPVVSVSRGASGPGTVRQVVVGVPLDDQATVARLVSRASASSLLLVRRPG